MARTDRIGLKRVTLALATSAVAAIGVVPGVAWAQAQTLDEALAAAYTNNPSLLSERADLRATDEGVPQALANWRPDVSISGDISRERTYLTSRTPERTKTRTPRGSSLDVTQPLFRGFRTLAATRSAEADVQAARASLVATEQTVLLNAVTAYVDVVADQAVLDLRKNNEQVLTRQLEATRDRFRVGEITRTDVSQAEARLAGATADRIQAEGTLAASRATFLNVIGERPGNLERPPDTAVGDLPISLEAAKQIAETDHPDIVAARYSELSAQETVRSVAGELLPTVSLSGSAERRFEVSADNNRQDDLSIGLSLSVPLYQQGAVFSRLRAAKQDVGKSRLDFETTRRNVIESLTSAWETLKSARAQIGSIKSQIQANEVALEGVQREAQVRKLFRHTPVPGTTMPEP